MNVSAFRRSTEPALDGPSPGRLTRPCIDRHLTAWLNIITMSVDVLTEIVINQPLAKVAAYAGDPDKAPEWYVNIKSVEWKTARPLEPGTQLTFIARFLRRRLEYTYEVIELARGERMVMRTAEGPFPMETTYTWEALDEDRTRMTLRNRGKPSGFTRLVAPFMAMAMRRANRNDLKRLKMLLESA